jgi:hypothetical protein
MKTARIGLAVVTFVLASVAVLAPQATAKERVLTLYSPKIYTRPYVHDTHSVQLRANGREAPAKGGFITGFKEQVLVDSKDPDAKPLPIQKMMIHHFLYFAPGRVDQGPGSCWGGSGFIGGRGEEHPSGDYTNRYPAAGRKRYGINNRLSNGDAPDWYLTAMVMNHYKRPKSFYVRTRVWYTDEPRKSVMPITVGNCNTLGNGMAYDVPGGGGPGSEYVDRTRWTVPEGLNGRIVGAASHQHGGGKYQSLKSVTCGRKIFKAPVYHGTPDHIYNTIRPILHEPGPIANGTYGSYEGIPISEGEVLERAAVHDNSNLHIASMGFWVLFVVKDDSVERCAPMPEDITQFGKPKRYDKTPNYGLKVPQLYRPTGPFQDFAGSPLTVDDQFFAPDNVNARAGEPVTWRFDGSEPHSVSVANGPRGFSSRYTGQTSGSYSFTPSVPGTYRLTCLVHPTTMGQTLVVR